MRRLRTLLAALVALLAPAGVAAACTGASPDEPAASLSSCGPVISLPQWSDSAGWSLERAWATIQLGQVDGQGGLDLIGRDSLGLWVHRFDADLGQWTVAGDGGPAANLQDALGWGKPRSYETIQTADVTGDGRAEMLARGAEGVEVHTWDPTAQVFTRLDRGTDLPFSDAAGWDDPQYFETIQAADVDGDRRAELMARTAGGLQTYRFAPATGSWARVGGALTDLGPGWGRPSSYRTIQTADIDGDGDAELIGRGPAGLLTFDWTAQGWTRLGDPIPLLDSDGWGDEANALTIQAADLDGDRAEELIARADDGLLAWKYTTAWVPLRDGANETVLADLSDTAGFGVPQRYATIVTGQMDGKGGREVIARTATGVRVWTRTGTGWSGGWRELTTRAAGSALDLTGPEWDQAQHYGTFRTGDVDTGSPGDELVARGPYGIRTWRFDAGAGRFARPRDYGAFPAFAGTRAGAYTGISRLVTADQSDDLRTYLFRTPNRIQGSTLTDAIGKVAGLCTENGQQDNGAPSYGSCRLPSTGVVIPPGVTPDDWTAASNEVIRELWAAEGLQDHFADLDFVLGRLFVSDAGEKDAIYAALQVPEDAPPDKAAEAFKIIADFAVITADAIVPISENFLKQGISYATKLRDAGRALAATAHTISAGLDLAAAIRAGEPKKDPPDTWAEIATDVVTLQQQAEDAVFRQRRYARADYGLLMAIGNQVKLGRLEVDRWGALSAGRRTFAEWVYKQYLPSYWEAWLMDDGCFYYWQGGRFCTTPTGPWVASSNSRSFRAVLPDTSYCTNHLILISCGFAEPTPLLARQLWGKVTDACQYNPLSPQPGGDPGSAPGALQKDGNRAWDFGCSIDANIQDMVNGEDGWAFPRTECNLETVQSLDNPCQTVAPWVPLTGGTAGTTAGQAERVRRGDAAVTPGRGSTVVLTARHGLGRSAGRSVGATIESLLVEEPGRITRRETATHLTGRTHRPLRMSRRLVRGETAVHRGRSASRRADLRIDRRGLTLRVRGLRLTAPEACLRGARTVTLETRVRVHRRTEAGRPGSRLIVMRGRWACVRAADGSHAGLRVVSPARR
ncbi:MAG: VCBS repeat-containing protein [Thermoleophilia bacterium]|nr:VCBS repeat-containing protein [Thermoleophilia bacterium]